MIRAIKAKTKAEAQAYVEAIVFALAATSIGYYFNPQDPLFIHANFPWAWLVPILIALRHGAFASGLSVCFIAVVMWRMVTTSTTTWQDVQLWSFGGLLIVLVCSEYQALWNKRHVQSRAENLYLRTRLESLTRAYAVLHLSHDRLEESLIIKPATLREAFVELRKLLSKTKGAINKETASQYLDLLSYFGLFDKAALYLHEHKKWNTTPIAALGKANPLLLDDILVKKCLEKHCTAYFGVNYLEGNESSAYLAVIPMESVQNHMMGLLAITEMSFLELNDESLKTLQILMAYITDEIDTVHSAQALIAQFPDCPALFAKELLKCMHMFNLAGIDSSLVTYFLKNGPQSENLLILLRHHFRGLDVFWERPIQNGVMLLALLPLTRGTMLLGYLERVQGLLQAQENVTLNTPPIFCKHRQLSVYVDVHALLTEVVKNDYF